MPASAERLIPAGGRVDIRDAALVRQTLDELRPDVVINASGYTAVDRAEDEAALAEEVNGRAVGGLAEACAERDIALVHFSTDYVFSGRASRPYVETDAGAPVNAYGRSKWMGELAIQASGAHALVLRTQWLFGIGNRSFPRTMLERALAHQPTRVVNDQTGRPTATRDLAAWTWLLIARGVSGTVHAANAGTATWYDVARQLFERVGRGDLLSPCSTADYPTRAERPRFSVLDTAKLERFTGPLPHWRESLADFARAFIE
jgi:dTDP-4-dehydrorhamnose reductase